MEEEDERKRFRDGGTEGYTLHVRQRQRPSNESPLRIRLMPFQEHVKTRRSLGQREGHVYPHVYQSGFLGCNVKQRIGHRHWKF